MIELQDVVLMKECILVLAYLAASRTYDELRAPECQASGSLANLHRLHVGTLAFTYFHHPRHLDAYQQIT